MDNIFEKLHYFIDTDIRTRRPKNYMMPITSKVMEQRHQLFFKKTDLKNKTVLDLGSCVGGTGAWVLSQGARHYTGVELQNSFAAQSRENLGKAFDQTQWDIVEQDINGYLERCEKTFDVILISGSIYSLIDYYTCIKHMCRIGKEIIIESFHPYFGLKEIFPDLTNDELMEKWKNFPVISMEMSGQTLHVGASQKYDSCRPSMNAFEKLFGHLCWKLDYSINPVAVKELPDIYSLDTSGYAIRFIIRAVPDKKTAFDFADCWNFPSEVPYDIKQW